MEFCGPRARMLAARLRGPRLPADVDAIAAGLGVFVSERSMSRYTLGLTVRDTQVVLRTGLDAPTRRFVLAHELGHVLVRRGLCPWVNHRSEEAFCDSFAAELIAPVERVRSGVELLELAKALDVPLAVVAAQRFPARAAEAMVTLGAVDGVAVMA